MAQVPSRLQGVLWSVPTDQLDLKKDKAYIINQVLMYGSLEDIRWLFKTYPKETIQEVFVNQPMKVYTKQGFNFIKNYVLGLRDRKLSPTNYVSAVYDQP